MTNTWKYTGPIFDAHTHIGTIDNVAKMVAIEDDFGVTKQIGIVHNEKGFLAAKERYSHRLIFAKYLSLRDIAQYNVEPVLDEISKMRDQGYSLAKSWFGPRWRDYHDVPKDFRINHQKLEPIFQELENLLQMSFPGQHLQTQLIPHISDPYRVSEDYHHRLYLLHIS